MPTSTGMTRLEQSFPFDSKADGYDSEGYPIYDRAVGAEAFRTVLSKMFSNGVFASPASTFQIAKGTGLTVTIQPGVGIINGAMGGIFGEDPLTVTLDTSSPQGNVCYGVMLRYDNTDSFIDSRSLLINVVRSDTAATPTPPAPDTTTPEVYELRLGYIEVPSGATDLTGATVHNEQGTEVCPFTAPFMEVDVSDIMAEIQAQGQEAYEALEANFDQYQELIESAIDQTTAGHLQTQINNLSVPVSDTDFVAYVTGAAS